MQGAVNVEDEKTFELSSPIGVEKGTTKKAQFFRAYRRDPEVNARINQQRRKNREMKKQQEMGNVSSMFESAARPSKAEQQTVEKTLSRSDNPSLPNLDGEASGELRDSSQSYCQEELSSVVTRRSDDVNTRKVSSSNSQDQADLLLELRDSFRGIHNELKMLREEVKPATPALPIDDKREQQTDASDIAIANDKHLSNEDDKTKKKTIAQVFLKKIPTFGLSLLIIIFLGFNTFFLVSEQQSLYQSMSYSASMALLIAVLSEASLLILSSMASWTSKLEWKLWLTITMVATVTVMVGILDSSAKNRSNTAARQSQEARNIEKQLDTLRALQAPILARIKNLDPRVYPTKINELSEQLTTPPNGLSYKIELLSNRLASINTAEADTFKLVWQRRVMLLINLVLSAFLGSIWSSKSNSLLNQFRDWISRYFSKPCEI